MALLMLLLGLVLGWLAVSALPEQPWPSPVLNAPSLLLFAGVFAGVWLLAGALTGEGLPLMAAFFLGLSLPAWGRLLRPESAAERSVLQPVPGEWDGEFWMLYRLQVQGTRLVAELMSAGPRSRMHRVSLPLPALDSADELERRLNRVLGAYFWGAGKYRAGYVHLYRGAETQLYLTAPNGRYLSPPADFHWPERRRRRELTQVRYQRLDELLAQGGG